VSEDIFKVEMDLVFLSVVQMSNTSTTDASANKTFLKLITDANNVNKENNIIIRL